MEYPSHKVTKKQYNLSRKILGGHIFHRIKDNCYWVMAADKYGSEGIDEIIKK